MSVRINETVKLRLQLADYLKRGIQVFLVGTQAMPLEIDTAGKCHHPIVYLAPMMAREEFIALLTTNERPRMENKRIGIQPKTENASVKPKRRS